MNKIINFRIRLFIKKAVASVLSCFSRPRLKLFPSVTLFVVNHNTRYPLEMTIKSLARCTSYPNYQLWIADNASQDGSVEYIESLDIGIPKRLFKSSERKSHGEWLDYISNMVNTRYWLIIDSDILFLGKDWLMDMIGVMEKNPKMYLLGCEYIVPNKNSIDPKEKKVVTEPMKLASWMFCIRTSLREHIKTPFPFYKEERDNTIFMYDTGSKLMEDMKANDLSYSYMPRWFNFKYYHFQSLSYVDEFASGCEDKKLKLYQLNFIKNKILKHF